MSSFTKVSTALIVGIVTVVPAYPDTYKEVCLSSSDKVLRQYPNSHAYYTSHMRGHEGTVCWHPGTKVRKSVQTKSNPIVPQVSQPTINQPVVPVCDLRCQQEFQKFLEWQHNRGGF